MPLFTRKRARYCCCCSIMWRHAACGFSREHQEQAIRRRNAATARLAIGGVGGGASCGGVRAWCLLLPHACDCVSVSGAADPMDTSRGCLPANESR